MFSHDTNHTLFIMINCQPPDLLMCNYYRMELIYQMHTAMEIKTKGNSMKKKRNSNEYIYIYEIWHLITEFIVVMRRRRHRYFRVFFTWG